MPRNRTIRRAARSTTSPTLGLLQIAYGRYLLALDPSLDVNEGLLQNLDEWITREGSIVQPRFPAPLGMRAHTRFRVVACMFGALAQANGGQVPANSPVYVLYYFRAQHPLTHQPILCIEGLGVGLGARPFADGIDAIYYIAQENYPVEYVEKDFPLRIEQYTMRPDSGGPGLYRGGCGIIRDVRVLCDKAELGTRMENTKFPPYGVTGGRAGRPGRILLNPGTPEEREIPQIGDGVQLKRGDLLRLMTCGGGGWGDPFSRDPLLVQQDVARGFVSVQGALEDYGVVLDPLSCEIDKAATEECRRRRPHSLPLFDRGPSLCPGRGGVVRQTLARVKPPVCRAELTWLAEPAVQPWRQGHRSTCPAVPTPFRQDCLPSVWPSSAEKFSRIILT